MEHVVCATEQCKETSGGGEKMNKKILVVFASFLFLVMLATPAMAAPATKIEGVTVTAAVTQTYDPGFPRYVSHGTIMHAKGTSTGTVTINIPDQDPLVGVWDGKFVNNAKISEDPAESVASITGKLVWTFTGKGTFEGVIQRTIIGYPPSGSSNFIDMVVLHGTRDFKGQTLKLSYDGTPPVISEGYLIIPK